MNTTAAVPGSDVIRLNSSCLTCLLNIALKQLPDGTPEEQCLEYKQRIMRIIGNAEPTMSPSEVTWEIQAVQREMFGMQVDYPAIKSFFNKKMMDQMDKAETWIRESEDPLLRAIQFSMCGNYIDFGVPHVVTEEKLEQILRDSDQIAVREDMLQEIREGLSHAGTVVFLHDNCGEVVMDKLLLKEIRRQFPQAELISVVRGDEVLNDATVEDAEEIGLSEVARILPNGDDVAGTCLKRISGECLETLQHADMILAKGQGNFETLRGCGLNVYYLFLCKCELYWRQFDVPAYTGIVIHDREAVHSL